MWAARKGRTEVVKFLLAAGADIGVKNIVSKRRSIRTYTCVF